MSVSKSMIREVVRALDVSASLSPRDFLKAVYDATKARIDGAYSYLQYAEDLGFSRSNVVRLMVIGERPMTPKAGERLADGLGLHGSARRYWTTLVRYVHERLPAERERLFQLLCSYRSQTAPRELDPLQLEYFSEWYHPAIREMAGLEGFDGTAEWIQERLGFPLRLEQVKRSVDLLKRLKLVVLEAATGRWVRGGGVIATSGEVDAVSIVRYHQKMLEVARESITVVDEDRRDVRAVTVSLPESALPLLKRRLEAFAHELAALEVEGGDEVVQINMQMFPFTKRRGPRS